MNSNKLKRILTLASLTCVIIVASNLYAQYRIQPAPLGLTRLPKNYPGKYHRLFETHQDAASSYIHGNTLELTVIPSHPRIFATAEKWDQLPNMIPNDPRLERWNNGILWKADEYLSQPVIAYSIDGALDKSGVLDVARQVQLRIKHWAYAYEMTKNAKFKDRIWLELVTSAGNSTQYFGESGDNWNTKHWLDVGEFLVAFSIAYDWLYHAWTPTEREAILHSIVSLGLSKGLDAYHDEAWFLGVKGNWNCVTNGGMIVASLSIYHEDPTGVSEKLLPLALNNSLHHCAQAVHNDGTWTETPDYWYFGAQAHAQLSSALLTATGSAHGMLTANPAFKDTGLFHIYNNGMVEKFNYGDCGPNKYTATANGLLLYGDQLGVPSYTIYQAAKSEAADPLSMFWYKPQASNEKKWFKDLPLDKSFGDTRSSWVSMRSSWTDMNGLFVAMKSGDLKGHEAHGNLDAGDFVIDAMGERWVGQLCQDDYNAPNYFGGEDQASQRWSYYRCQTAGQNTFVYNGTNQLVDGVAESPRFDSTNTLQMSESSKPGNESTAYWVANLSPFYDGPTIRRGLRLLERRRKVLIQDEMEGNTLESQWRLHTNATISLSRDGRTARFILNNKAMDVSLQAPTDAQFQVLVPARLSNSPTVPDGAKDLSNPGVGVLSIDIPPGNTTVMVIFNPLWEQDADTSQFDDAGSVEISNVPLKDWNLSSH